MIIHVVSISVLICAVLVIRALFRKTVSPVLLYALWIAVVLKLFIPIPLFEVSFSEVFQRNDVTNESHVSEVPENNNQDDSEPSILAPITPPEDIYHEDNDAYVPVLPENPPINIPVTPDRIEDTEQGTEPEIPVKTDWIKIANTVWIIGAALTAVAFITSSAVFTSKVRRDREFLRKINGTKVYVSENAGGSCLAGLIPSIYLTPEAAFSRDSTLVMIHEYTHLRHGDFLWSFIRMIGLTVFWWNPIMWAAAIVSKHDAELACDYAIVKKLDDKKRYDYAKIIINTIPQQRILSLGIGSGEIKERIFMITKKQSNRAAAAVLSIIMCIIAVGCAFIGEEKTEIYDGMYLRGDNGEHIIVVDEKPFEIEVKEDISFDNIDSGDRIQIEGTLDLLKEKLGKAKITLLLKLSDGKKSDIPADVIYSLVELGIVGPENIGVGPFVPYFRDNIIELYTKKDGVHIADIPADITRDFPASDGLDGWYEYIDVYCGGISDFRWAVLTTGPVMGNSNYNLCTSFDGGMTWNIGDRASLPSGTVTGAIFISSEIGFIGYRHFMTGGPEIAQTQDGGKTWEMVYLSQLDFLSDYRMDPMTPEYTDGILRFPIKAENEDGEEIIYIVSNDSGKTWQWDITNLDTNGDDSEEINAFTKFILGDRSILSSAQGVEHWIPDFQDETFDYEYAYMDLDGDGKVELLVQMKDFPEGYNGVFHYENGKVICWTSDSSEGSMRDYPLVNGTMVRQYDYNGNSNYTIFRYLSDGQKEDITHFIKREESMHPNSTSPSPYYSVNYVEVGKSAFDKQLNDMITSQMLDRSAWILVQPENTEEQEQIAFSITRPLDYTESNVIDVSSDEYGEVVAVTSNVDLNGIEIVAIVRENNFEITELITLHTVDLVAGESMLLKVSFPGVTGNRGLIYRDTYGVKRYCEITKNGEDGKFILISSESMAENFDDALKYRYTSDINNFIPPEADSLPKITVLTTGKMVLTYETDEKLPLVYFGEVVDAESVRVTKTEFVAPDFVYTDYEVIDYLYENGYNVYATVRFTRTDGTQTDVYYYGYMTNNPYGISDQDYKWIVFSTEEASELNLARAQYDPAKQAEHIPGDATQELFWLKTKSACYFFCSIRTLNSTGTAYTDDPPKDFAIFYQRYDQNIFYVIDEPIPEEYHYDSIVPVLAITGEGCYSMNCILKLTDGDKIYYLRYAEYEGIDQVYHPVPETETKALAKYYPDILG